LGYSSLITQSGLGAVIREKESEYQKNLDDMTSEIPIINLDLENDN
jgi:hypothetical protein